MHSRLFADLAHSIKVPTHSVTMIESTSDLGDKASGDRSSLSAAAPVDPPVDDVCWASALFLSRRSASR